MTDIHRISDAIRNVTATVQQRIDRGERNAKIDANDVVEILLAIADHIDPPFGDPEYIDCPKCGRNNWEEINPDHAQIRCCACGHTEFG